MADRARYPDGTVALRLEPFSDEQVRAWVGIWNRTNERHFADTGTLPLPDTLAEHHRELAVQPLLLLMLALYDATGNALQRGDTPLNEADLYEDLLVAFAAREVGKSAAAEPPAEVAFLVRQELERLSLVAFAMLNRRRQWVTASELGDDLDALLGRLAAESRFRGPLGHGDIALGRFFFIQRAQAVQDGHRLATYEFLHATFGEYLAVRLAVDLFRRLIHQQPTLIVGPAPVDDDLLYVLLSYVPLSARQMLRFVRARVGRIPERDRRRLAELVVQVIAVNAARTQHAHEGYRPDPGRPTSSRHGLYEANLLLVLLALTGGFQASRIFPDSPDTPATWHRRALLWRSSMTEEEWTEFALALRLRHTRAAGGRDLEILPASDSVGPPEPVDPSWLYGYASENGDTAWRRTYWAEVMHKMDVSGGTNDSVVRHALEPVAEFLGPELMTFYGHSDGHASSLVHDLLRLWLTSRLATSWRPLAVAYQRCAEWLSGSWVGKVRPLMLDLLAADAERLPPELVAGLLRPLEDMSFPEPDSAASLLSAAVAALASRPSPVARQSLLAVARRAAQPFAATDVRGWEAWLKVHDHGLAGAVFGATGAERLTSCDLDALPPTLRHRILRVAAVDYPQIVL